MRKSSVIRRIIIPIFIVLMLAFGGFSVPTRAAGPWYVKKTGGSDTNDCLSPATACVTINGAIGKASSTDTIYVTAETYTGSGTEVVDIYKSITISGGWNVDFTTQSGLTTIDGGNSRGGIDIPSGHTVTLERFAIENGNIVLGGGIYSEADLTLNQCELRNNHATDIGGGLYVSVGTVILNDCILDSNSSDGGGGGIFVQEFTTVTLNRTTMTNNNADSSGGAIAAWGNIVLNNSTLSGNTAYYGGGAVNIIEVDSSVTSSNSTITDNTVTMWGGGIRNDGSKGTVTLSNTILAGNHAGWSPDCQGPIGSGGYNLIGSTVQCTFTSTTGDLTNVDPKLGSLADNGGPTYTHSLLSTSPAINQIQFGTNGCGTTYTTDQRGVSRPQGAYCDIGAYELVIRKIADFDGDHDTDISVFRPSNGRWYMMGQSSVSWAISGDLPVPGDYNGDGTTDIAVYRPSNGKWYV